MSKVIFEFDEDEDRIEIENIEKQTKIRWHFIALLI